MAVAAAAMVLEPAADRNSAVQVVDLGSSRPAEGSTRAPKVERATSSTSTSTSSTSTSTSSTTTDVGPGYAAATESPEVMVRDFNEDLECAQDYFVRGTGTLTNRGGETASYSIHVTFHDADHVRFAEGLDHSSNVRVGETIAWEAIGIESSPPQGWYCEIVSVTRYP